MVWTVTGHRGNAIRQLRWNDADLDDAETNCPSDTDKEETAHQSPLTAEAVEELRRARKEAGRIGEALMFPSRENENVPISRYTVISWWKKLEKGAGIRRVKGRGWHWLRRKLVNDAQRAGIDLSIVAEIGGSSGTKTLTEVYLEPDKKLGRDAAETLAKMRAMA